MRTNGDSANEDFRRKLKQYQYENKNEEEDKYYIKPEDILPKEEVNRIVKEWTKAMERSERKKRPNSKKRKLKCNKDTSKSAKINKKKKYRGNIKKKVLSIVLAVIAVAGGYSIKNEYKKQNTPVSVEQVENKEALGINRGILLKLQKLQKIVEKDSLTNQEIINLASEISELQIELIQTKLGDLLQEPASNISVDRNYLEEEGYEELVEVIQDCSKNKVIYKNKNIFNFKNTISCEISNYIVQIDKMNSLEIQLRDEDFYRKEVIEKYKEALVNISQFAGMKLNIDENGNISADVTKVKDLDNVKYPIKTARVEQDIDEER